MEKGYAFDFKQSVASDFKGLQIKRCHEGEGGRRGGLNFTAKLQLLPRSSQGKGPPEHNALLSSASPRYPRTKSVLGKDSQDHVG